MDILHTFSETLRKILVLYIFSMLEIKGIKVITGEIIISSN